MKTLARKTALSLCLLLAGMGLARAATPLATATIVDGEVQVIRDASRLQLAEGVRLAQNDILEAGAKARFVRLEFADGVILDLGPESRVLLSPRFGADRAKLPARVHLLKGVAKLTVPKPVTPPAAFTTPALDVMYVARSAVFIVQGAEAQVFAEAGEVGLQERRGGKPADLVTLKGSEFYARGTDGKGATAPRPSGTFIQKLPRPFLDTLPPRAPLFATREVAPKALGDITYADAEPWVDAEGLRPQFVTRWRPLAQQPAFREGLAANMASHPEWDRVLYPEKYLPKPPASSPSGAYGRKP